MEKPSSDVHGSSSPVASEGANPQTQLPEVPVVTPAPVTPPVGSQTPPENLYAALAEERRLRKEAEDKLTNLTTTAIPEDVYSDEGKLLRGQITSLEAKVASIEEEKNLERLFNQYPLLREKSAEFIEYRQTEHPRAKLESVAKLFLAENGLLEPTRQGLEKPTGGPRVPQPSGMSNEDIENLRKNDYRRYKEMVQKDQIKFS